MGNDTLVHSDYYDGFQIEIFSTPDSELWSVGYYVAIYDSNGTERLDSSDYEPKDFLHRDIDDALAGAKFQIDRYWKFGGNWYPTDDEVRKLYHKEAVEQGYRI